MKLIRTLFAVALVAGLALSPARAYVITGAWADDDLIVFDNIFAPAIWVQPAEEQLQEWNFVDRAAGDHPFSVHTNPDFSFGANDGTNTMGFLGEELLYFAYGLTYDEALAWTASWSNGSGDTVESDVMVDPARPWSLTPDDTNWFQSTVLHELTHVRGLDHHQTWQAMMNNATGKLLRDETLYMDDIAGVRVFATTVQDVDIAVYPKSHNQSTMPRWMTVSATTVREGQQVSFSNWSMENRGALWAGDVPFNLVLSSSAAILAPLQTIGSGTFPGVQGEIYRIGNWTTTIPTQQDCSQKYVGVDVPSNPAWNERFEQNNTVAFTNGSRDPVLLSILLRRDGLEPNDSRSDNEVILPRDYSNGALSLDSNSDQDYYVFILSETMTVVLDLAFTHARGDVEVQLQRYDGTVLASSTSVSDNEHIQARLAPGPYVIRVYGAGSNPCNRYSMTLRSYECLERTDCPGDTDPICGNVYCNTTTYTCAQFRAPCDDGISCTQDFCFPVHGGYCLNVRDPFLDPDSDGVCGATDLCPNVPDPANRDSDRNGIGDACDTGA